MATSAPASGDPSPKPNDAQDTNTKQPRASLSVSSSVGVKLFNQGMLDFSDDFLGPAEPQMPVKPNEPQDKRPPQPASSSDGSWYCEECQTTYQRSVSKAEHLASKKHRAKAARHAAGCGVR